MKDIKSYVIGFLSCACLFLIMGQTDGEKEYGNYQLHQSENQIYILNTNNGDTWKINNAVTAKGWNKTIIREKNIK